MKVCLINNVFVTTKTRNGPERVLVGPKREMVKICSITRFGRPKQGTMGVQRPLRVLVGSFRVLVNSYRVLVKIDVNQKAK